MCSVGDDHFETEETKCMPAKEKLISLDAKCNKCREEPPVVLLRSKDVYCKSCFLAGTNHKFKALLGKHKLIRAGDRVLVHHKLGHPSTALLHFLRTGLDLNTPKKLRFDVTVVYIEDNSQYNLAYRKEILNKVQKELKLFNFELSYVSFTQYVTKGCVLPNISKHHEELEINDDDRSKLYEIFNKSSNKTDKNDLLHLFKRNLLTEIARKLNCKFIFTPDISIDIASQLLSDISLGRGSHVPIDTGFCDDRNGDVKLIRPLRLFDMKELAFYNQLNNLVPISVKQSQVNPYSSVQDLMKKFVSELQVNYPATVTTIMKTGDKLALTCENNQKCKLCQGPIVENNSDTLTSEESTSFSHWVSTRKLDDNSLSREEKYRELIQDYNKLKITDYCYSCNKLNKVLQTHKK